MKLFSILIFSFLFCAGIHAQDTLYARNYPTIQDALDDAIGKTAPVIIVEDSCVSYKDCMWRKEYLDLGVTIMAPVGQRAIINCEFANPSPDIPVFALYFGSGHQKIKNIDFVLKTVITTGFASVVVSTLDQGNQTLCFTNCRFIGAWDDSYKVFDIAVH